MTEGTLNGEVLDALCQLGEGSDVDELEVHERYILCPECGDTSVACCSWDMNASGKDFFEVRHAHVCLGASCTFVAIEDDPPSEMGGGDCPLC